MNGGLGGLDASDYVSEPMRRSESLNGRPPVDTLSMRSRSYNSEGDIQVAIRSMRASSMSQEMVEVSTICDGRRDNVGVGPRKITRTTSHQRSVIIEDAPDDGEKGKDGGAARMRPAMVSVRWEQTEGTAGKRRCAMANKHKI